MSFPFSRAIVAGSFTLCVIAVAAMPSEAVWDAGPRTVLETLGTPARAVNEQYFFKDGERLGAVRRYITKQADCAAFLEKRDPDFSRRG